VDGVLVTEPVGALDRVVHVPSPVVLVHVAERGVDAALGGDRVASRGEELGNAGRVEASLGQAEGGTQTGAAGTDDERIVLMVLVQPKVNSLCPSDTARIPAEGGGGGRRHTMTGYLLLTNGDASFARSGPLAKTRAIDQKHKSVHARSPRSPRQELGSTYQPVVLWKRPGSGHARAAEWTSG
jgi:hypothetical protein